MPMRIGSSSSSFFGTTIVRSAFSCSWCATARMRPERALISSRAARFFSSRSSSGTIATVGSSRLDQGERAVLQLGGGIGLGVDVRDLLELERGLAGDGVATDTADEHHRAGVRVLLGDLLDRLFLLQDLGDLAGELAQALDDPLAVGDGQVADAAEVEGEEREGDRGVGEALGRDDADLGARVDVHAGCPTRGRWPSRRRSRRRRRGRPCASAPARRPGRRTSRRTGRPRCRGCRGRRPGCGSGTRRPARRPRGCGPAPRSSARRSGPRGTRCRSPGSSRGARCAPRGRRG